MLRLKVYLANTTAAPRKFDFIETFNTCESAVSNSRAKILADEYKLPGFAGSDAHVCDYLGMACTEIDADIRGNNDLIEAVKNRVPIRAYGIEREQTKGKAQGALDRNSGLQNIQQRNRKNHIPLQETAAQQAVKAYCISSYQNQKEYEKRGPQGQKRIRTEL